MIVPAQHSSLFSQTLFDTLQDALKGKKERFTSIKG